MQFAIGARVKTRNDFNCKTCGVPENVCESQLVCVAPVWELALQSVRAVANEPPTRPAVKLPEFKKCVIATGLGCTESGEPITLEGIGAKKLYDYIQQLLIKKECSSPPPPHSTKH
jgi:hypothetical protein